MLPGFHLENFIRGGKFIPYNERWAWPNEKWCGFYSKLGYCEGVVEEFKGDVGELGGKLPPCPLAQ